MRLAVKILQIISIDKGDMYICSIIIVICKIRSSPNEILDVDVTRVNNALPSNIIAHHEKMTIIMRICSLLLIISLCTQDRGNQEIKLYDEIRYEFSQASLFF